MWSECCVADTSCCVADTPSFTLGTYSRAQLPDDRPRLLVPGGGGTLLEIGADQPACSLQPSAARSAGSIRQNMTKPC
jgi:hypothetical protein